MTIDVSNPGSKLTALKAALRALVYPSGGNDGDVLTKVSGSPEWAAPSGGGGAAYVAKAVHFNGGTWLRNAALSAPNSGRFSYSFWIRRQGAALGNGDNPTVFVSDPESQYNNVFYYTHLNKVGFASFQNNSDYVTWHPTGNSGPDQTWHHVLVSVDCNAAPARPFRLYFDGVDVTHSIGTPNDPAEGGNAFSLLYNSLSFWIGNDGFGNSFTGDMADVWIAPGASLLSNGDVPLATLRKFIDASRKPVDPSGFPPAAILLSGDAGTFATNQGTGGSFVVTGSLTNATSSPSDLLPAGGGVGDVLTVSADGPAWEAPVKELPTTGSDGDVLTVVSGEPAWATPVTELPPPGNDADVLTLVSGQPAWAPVPSPPPGGDGDVVKLASGLIDGSYVGSGTTYFDVTLADGYRAFRLHIMALVYDIDEPGGLICSAAAAPGDFWRWKNVVTTDSAQIVTNGGGVSHFAQIIPRVSTYDVGGAASCVLDILRKRDDPTNSDLITTGFGRGEYFDASDVQLKAVEIQFGKNQATNAAALRFGVPTGSSAHITLADWALYGFA